MKLTREEMKNKAVDCLKELDIFKPYIKAFVKDDEVTMFEHYGGYYISQYPELYNQIKELEQKYDILVYAVTHEFTDFGECYSFLYVPKDKDDLEYTIAKYNSDSHYAMAYVYNKSEPMFSEFGSIVVKSGFGGITPKG
jgi:hypothetical protein